MALLHNNSKICKRCWIRILRSSFSEMSGHSTATTPPKPVKRKLRSQAETKAREFQDFRKIQVKGGNGGNGAMSFLSLYANEYAGPDGGDGGNGGHVIIQAGSGKKDLSNIETVQEGNSGVNGRKKHMHGKNAEHKYVKVPVGTLVRNSEGELLADLNKDGEIFVAARGGAGGKGNHFFLSNENRAPTTYELGGKGEMQQIMLELRVMAQVGLFGSSDLIFVGPMNMLPVRATDAQQVGFPNAGKSTLLRAVSRARPKVASYPFTTLKPHVGIILFDDLEQVAVADLPGLVRGAHQNYGLGFSFLRHIQRCACLMYVLDLAVKDPYEQLDDLMFELNQYEENLAHRPHAIVANKMDLPGAEEKLKVLQGKINLPLFPISAKKLIGIKELVCHIRDLYDEHRQNTEG